MKITGKLVKINGETWLIRENIDIATIEIDGEKLEDKIMRILRNITGSYELTQCIIQALSDQSTEYQNIPTQEEKVEHICLKSNTAIDWDGYVRCLTCGKVLTTFNNLKDYTEWVCGFKANPKPVELPEEMTEAKYTVVTEAEWRKSFNQLIRYLKAKERK